MKTADAARGKWKGILMALGIDDRYLTGKHGPCPSCEGRDRFRWDNQNGDGGFICNICGAGNGFNLLMRVKGWDFPTAAKEVDRVVGNARQEPIRPKMDDRKRRDLLNQLWLGASPVCHGDPAHGYLASRDCLLPSIPVCLRFHAACPVPESPLRLPAMLAMVYGPDGAPVNVHRTYLGPNGKADIENPRAMMPGELPDGSAVRLSPLHGGRLGIAEGIETAIRAGKRFNVPTWAAINSTMLAKFIPPAGVEELLIFGDCDPKYGGQAAAYRLAHRAAAQFKLRVQVHIPQTMGTDWADSDAA